MATSKQMGVAFVSFTNLFILISQERLESLKDPIMHACLLCDYFK